MSPVLRLLLRATDDRLLLARPGHPGVGEGALAVGELPLGEHQAGVPDLEDVRDELAASVRSAASSGAVTDWFLEQINTAEVTIDPEYGSWEDTGTGAFTVVPPSPEG